MKYTAEELLKRRLAGVRPRVWIVDRWYIVDVAGRELRSAGGAHITIDLNMLPLAKDGNSYEFLFNPKMGAIGKAAGTDAVLVSLPNEKILDPVGVALLYGLESTALISTYPIMEQHYATVSKKEELQGARTAKSPIRRLLKKSKGKGI